MKTHEDYKFRGRLSRALQTWDRKYHFVGHRKFTFFEQLKRSINSFLDTPSCLCKSGICSIHEKKLR